MRTDVGNRFPSGSRAVVLGITGAWAFAAGTVLLALRRHNPDLDADVIVFHDGRLTSNDADMLRKLGARPLPFMPPPADLTDEALKVFSPLVLAKFDCFSLLRDYASVVWLDADILLQDAIAELFSAGPLGLAPEDPDFMNPPGVNPARINLHGPVPGFDGEAANLNSGVIVFRADLPSPENLRRACLDFVCAHGRLLRYPDQAAFNFLAQMLRRDDGWLVDVLPQRFNTHPRNPAATFAPVVHAFGAYKLWNDGLTAACFPEWQRDYARWTSMGGSPYAGPVENVEFLKGGAFSLLSGLYDTLEKTEAALEELRKRLAVEAGMRARLEAVLHRLS